MLDILGREIEAALQTRLELGMPSSHNNFRLYSYVL